jgi:hypothetical protein
MQPRGPAMPCQQSEKVEPGVDAVPEGALVFHLSKGREWMVSGAILDREGSGACIPSERRSGMRSEGW